MTLLFFQIFIFFRIQNFIHPHFIQTKFYFLLLRYVLKQNNNNSMVFSACLLISSNNFILSTPWIKLTYSDINFTFVCTCPIMCHWMSLGTCLSFQSFLILFPKCVDSAFRLPSTSNGLFRNRNQCYALRDCGFYLRRLYGHFITKVHKQSNHFENQGSIYVLLRHN
jgi:hypothetical protein